MGSPDIKRGDVWLVALDPTVGHEIKKTRPAVVVTRDAYNEGNWVIQVMPLTTRDHGSFDQVVIAPPDGGLKNTSVTLPDQTRSVDRDRLQKKLGTLDPSTMKKIDGTIRIVFGV